MKKNRVISAFILLLLFVFSSSAVVTAEEKKIRLRIESAFPLELAICNPFTTAMKQLEENSGGSIDLAYHSTCRVSYRHRLFLHHSLLVLLPWNTWAGMNMATVRNCIRRCMTEKVLM